MLFKWLPVGPQRNPEHLNRLGKPFKASFSLCNFISPHFILFFPTFNSEALDTLNFQFLKEAVFPSPPNFELRTQLNCSSCCPRGSSHPFPRPIPDSSFGCQLKCCFLWLFWLCLQSILYLVLTLLDCHLPLGYCKLLEGRGSLASAVSSACGAMSGE